MPMKDGHHGFQARSMPEPMHVYVGFSQSELGAHSCENSLGKTVACSGENPISAPSSHPRCLLLPQSLPTGNRCQSMWTLL